MESPNLHELSRKELKQLCNEHNIRTAGVKVEFLDCGGPSCGILEFVISPRSFCCSFGLCEVC